MPGTGTPILTLTSRELNISSANEFSAVTDVPLFLGYIFSYFLQGILLVQVFVYWLSFKKDHRYMKITVLSVFFVECLSSVFGTAMVIDSIILNGDLAESICDWGFKAVAVLCGISTFMVHAFYSWRIHILYHSLANDLRQWVVPAVVMILSLIQCIMVSLSGAGSSLDGEGGMLEAGTLSQEDPKILSINILWLAGSAVCDIIIATTLLLLLRRATDKLSSRRAQSRAERVIATAIDTGMITAIGAAIELLFFLALPNTLIHFILFYMLPKLYANCLMATLNARLAVPGRGFRESGRDWASTTQPSAEDELFGNGKVSPQMSSGLEPFDTMTLRNSMMSSRRSSIMDLKTPEIHALENSVRCAVSTPVPLDDAVEGVATPVLIRLEPLRAPEASLQPAAF